MESKSSWCSSRSSTRCLRRLPRPRPQPRRRQQCQGRPSRRAHSGHWTRRRHHFSPAQPLAWSRLAAPLRHPQHATVFCSKWSNIVSKLETLTSTLTATVHASAGAPRSLHVPRDRLPDRRPRRRPHHRCSPPSRGRYHHRRRRRRPRRLRVRRPHHRRRRC
jgi:hypothetical protein